MSQSPKSFLSTMALLALIGSAPSYGEPVPPSPEDFTKEMQALSQYDLGLDRSQVAALMDNIRALGEGSHAKVETALLTILGDAKAPLGAKDITCRLLGQVGSDQSVPALTSLLPDPSLSHLAAYALFEIGTPGAQTALLTSLDRIPDELRPAVIGALGRLHDTEALGPLVKLAASNSIAVSEAAIDAIAALPTTEAADQLSALKVPSNRRSEVDWARIRNAKGLLAGKASDQENARQTLTTLAQSSTLSSIQVASATLLMQANPGAAWNTVSTLLKSTVPHLAVDAARLTAWVPADQFNSLLSLFPTLDSAVQVVIVNSVSESKNPGVESLLKLALGSDKPAVHLAALAGYGTADLPSSVAVLEPFLTQSKDDAAAAVEAMARLKNNFLLGNFDFTKATGPEKVTLLNLTALRKDASFKDQVFSLTNDPEVSVENAAYEAIAAIASAHDLEKLLAMLPMAKNDEQRKCLNRALTQSANLAPDPAKTQDELIGALDKVPAPDRQSLVLVLVSIGSDQSVAALSKLLDDPSVDTRKGLIRTLSQGRNPVADKLLLQAARNGKEDSEKILALRGYLDSIQSQKIKAPARVEALKIAWPIAIRLEEKEAIISALKGIREPAAQKLADNLGATVNNSTQAK